MGAMRSLRNGTWGMVGGAIALALVVGSSRPIVATEPEAIEQAVERGVNEKRAAHHLSPLVHADDLSRVARLHSEEMAREGRMAHETRDGRGPADRVFEARIPYRRLAENVATAKGHRDPVRVVVSGWMDSSGHRANILDPNVAETGTGVAVGKDGTVYFTQLFLARAEGEPTRKARRKRGS